MRPGAQSRRHRAKIVVGSSRLAFHSISGYRLSMRKLMIISCFGLLAGCVSTARTIVTAPVRVVGKGVDWTTTSQDEADRNRGREMRKQEERERKERERQEKEWRRQQRDD